MAMKNKNVAEAIKNGLKIRPKIVEQKMVDFLKQNTKQAGFQRVIMGLSGGIDSGIVAYMSCKALGPENVFVVLMPYRLSSPASVDDAKRVINALNIPDKNVFKVDITPQIDAWVAKSGIDQSTKDEKLRLGNKLARERMSVLYDKSAELKALVVGTSNMSELAVGYGTIFGDTACAINPLGNIYKTQEKQLVSQISGLEFLAQKTPTADLWPEQTDEGELNIKYADLDEILFGLINKKMSVKKIISSGYEKDKVELVMNKILANEFKRRPIPIAKINNRSLPVDIKKFTERK